MRHIFTIFFLASICPHTVFSAENSNSELLIVKEALVEAAMEKGVSVVSNAYIDSGGELIESSFYRSGVTLRGIRMPQYFLDEPYDAKLLFSDTAFNTSLNCQELSPHRYRKAISIDTSSVSSEDFADQQFGKILASLRSEIDMSATSAIAANESYYIIPIDYGAKIITSQYEAALLPQTSSADSRNTNFIIKAEIANVNSVNYSAERMYEKGLTQARRVGKLISTELGLRSVLTASPGKAISSVSLASIDFDLKISFLRNGGLKENVEKTIELRFDREKNRIKIREPLLNQLTNFTSRLNYKNISFNEASSSARDLAHITASFKSVLESSTAQINCEIEELKTYRADVDGESAATIKLNQGIIAGISVGDRFILSESNFSTSLNPISSDQLESLAIAEVIRTEQYNADLRIVEGPSQDLYSLSAIPF
ncbi:hypothetical protein N9F57_03890 [Gammaproteobacteria bacterium]|nr:hypothetical protein [Gammaproteobacteria bacterium]